MNFDEYLISKKIDATGFKQAEPTLYQEWNAEFDQMHVNSFTVQKLNLINPIRRKYQLKESVGTVVKENPTPTIAPTITSPPRVARPVYNKKTS